MDDATPKVRVDFNELVEQNLVLLSKADSVSTVEGEQLSLHEGMAVLVFMDDADENGNPKELIARGRVEKNRASDWSKDVKWACRITSWICG